MINHLHIYTRVSTLEQKESGTSLDTQKELGEKLSKQVSKGKFKLWDEGSQSSFKDDLDNRPVLMGLLDQVDKGNIKHLYVFNTDRLSRNQKTWGLIRYKLLQNSVLLYVGSDPNPIDLSDPLDNLLVGILSEISNYDNRIRMERFRLGKIQRVLNGNWFGGPPPFGYEIKDKKLSINEEEMKWVKFIFESFVDGNTIEHIRNQLFLNGVKSRRGNLNWSNGSLEQLFKNTHFEGFYEFTDKTSGETYRIDCPTNIPISLVNNVRKLREERSYKRGKGRVVNSGNQKKDYLLKGLLECGCCGSKFGGRTVKTQYIEHYYCLRNETNYRDKNTYKYKECKKGRRSLRVSVSDDLIWNKVVDVCENSFLFKEENKQEILSKKNFEVDRQEIKKLEIKGKKFDKEINNIDKNIIQLESDKLLNKRSEKEVDGIIENLRSHRLNVLSKKENLKEQIEGSKTDLRWIDWVDDFSSRINTIRSEKDLSVRKKFLSGLIDKIVVDYVDNHTHTLRLFFKIPYINDKMIWKDENNKKLGYDIKKGKKNIQIEYDENKLYIDRRTKKKLMKETE